MALDGYDHIIDIVDADGTGIAKVARARGHFELATYLDDLHTFEVSYNKVFLEIKLRQKIILGKS